jgi:prepilin-type N-terminal cleavage/methylation domain-containing protein
MHHRRAFTLLELLAACTVLGVGVLALASTSVAIARLTGDAQRAGIAAERGQARVESMRAAGCSASSGAGVGNGVSEWWSAAPAAPGISLTDSLQFTAGAMHALRTETLATASGCP